MKAVCSFWVPGKSPGQPTLVVSSLMGKVVKKLLECPYTKKCCFKLSNIDPGG